MRIRDQLRSSSAGERQVDRILEAELQESAYRAHTHIRCHDVLEAAPRDQREDRKFLWDAHFDFVVFTRRSSRPVWALEFDGDHHRTDPEQQRRDLRKNRICWNAGLPLLRIDGTHLRREDERLSLVGWMVRRWEAYERLAPQLQQQVDAELKQLTPAELEAWMPWPEFDVELLFDLEEPYPPLLAITRRLYEACGAVVPRWTRAAGIQPDSELVRWTVEQRWDGAVMDLAIDGLRQRWDCPIDIYRRRGARFDSAEPEQQHAVQLTASQELAIGYPLTDDPDPAADWDGLINGRWCMAGPWGGSPAVVGGALAEYVALRKAENWLQRTTRNQKRRGAPAPPAARSDTEPDATAR